MNWLAIFICFISLYSFAGAKKQQITRQELICEEKKEIDSKKMTAGYNASARISPAQGINAFANVSFIYWYVTQDGMDLALASGAQTNVSPPPNFFTLNPPSSGSNFLFSNFSYQPGFKLGVGYNFNQDDWVGAIEYTRLHQSVSTSTQSAPADPRSDNTSVWVVSNWYADLQPISANIGSKWEMHFDFIKATLSRPFYQGSQLILLPSGGVAALILNQNMRLSSSFLGADISPAISQNHSHSWGLGPCAGLESQWLLGKGFRMDGNIGASLLFTQYTTVYHQDNATFLSATVPQTTTTFRYKNYNTARPLANMLIGVGWNQDFSSQKTSKWNLDLMAAYEWNILWSQNMMRTLVDNFLLGTGAAQNLYFHGLTFTVQANF